MKNRRVKELIRKEQRLSRELVSMAERHDELVAAAMSTGSFRYDQDRVTGSSPDGSRQERIVMEYVTLEAEMEQKKEELRRIRKTVHALIRTLPQREQRIIIARHVRHEEVQDIMQRYGLSYETYRAYHKTAMKRMEKKLQENIDNIP